MQNYHFKMLIANFTFCILIVPFGIGYCADTTILGKNVKFSHKKHSILEGGCKACHHYYTDKPLSCKMCHKEVQTGSILSLKDTYHKKCIECHKKPKGPSECKECHTMKTTKVTTCMLPTICIMDSLIKDYGSVTFSHSKHIGTSSNCSICHHQYKPQSCKNCHLKPLNINIPKLKGAYHQQCILCHKQAKAPVGCQDCHIKSQESRVRSLESEVKSQESGVWSLESKKR